MLFTIDFKKINNKNEIIALTLCKMKVQLNFNHNKLTRFLKN